MWNLANLSVHDRRNMFSDGEKKYRNSWILLSLYFVSVCLLFVVVERGNEKSICKSKILNNNVTVIMCVCVFVCVN
jgi:hypothetical protein